MLRQILTACLLIIVPFGFFETIAFAVVGIGLHEPPTFLGIIATAQGVGAIGGGLTAAAVMKRTNEGALFAFACLLFAAASLLLTLQWLPGVLVGAIVVGACLPWVLVALFTLVQRRTPLALQGRVYSAFDTLIGVPADDVDRGWGRPDRVRRLPPAARLCGADGGDRGGVPPHA